MSASASAPSAAPTIPPTKTPDAKILSDLDTVNEKISLCSSMLEPLTSVSQVNQPGNESLLAIIGFLEACVPRVRDLVEAGMTGALKEDTVVKCLAINDSLCQVLELVEHPEKCEPPPASKTPEPDSGDVTDQFDAFAIEENDDNAGQKKPAASTSPTLEDLLSVPNDAPPATAPNNDSSTKQNDEFDDFFGERMDTTKNFD
eukprot:CAMPEP_0197237122 /NCGR_PEP_ID=MMETSP1429-20130617/4043_1 /TAXON_ID=49237 /ORGANISM="Chaetoceros  sp., Strain UNC1202" /LENGTH=201 /DNA_ID=CAMNT_0042696057 /DNA_START=86 /DNA_END=691 /DNA_ORIENTATION=+